MLVCPFELGMVLYSNSYPSIVEYLATKNSMVGPTAVSPMLWPPPTAKKTSSDPGITAMSMIRSKPVPPRAQAKARLPST